VSETQAPYQFGGFSNSANPVPGVCPVCGGTRIVMVTLSSSLGFETITVRECFACQPWTAVKR
jgi:hypothetical protein